MDGKKVFQTTNQIYIYICIYIYIYIYIDHPFLDGLFPNKNQPFWGYGTRHRAPRLIDRCLGTDLPLLAAVHRGHVQEVLADPQGIPTTLMGISYEFTITNGGLIWFNMI